MLSSVFRNLLGNAVRHNDKQTPEITITGCLDSDTVQIRVADNGPGIPEEELKYIWNRFHKVDKSRTRNESGTGLGLSIVKKIIEQHQGRVTVESEVGKGSKFSFILPKDKNIKK
jgi:two-component system sensor histidine kinase ResE